MLLAVVELRRVEQSLLSEQDTVVGVRFDQVALIENILRLLPDTKAIVFTIGNSPNERFVESPMSRKGYGPSRSHWGRGGCCNGWGRGTRSSRQAQERDLRKVVPKDNVPRGNNCLADIALTYNDDLECLSCRPQPRLVCCRHGDYRARGVSVRRAAFRLAIDCKLGCVPALADLVTKHINKAPPGVHLPLSLDLDQTQVEGE
jgi:hypothetical protein